jgi:eukaryotic-like serine/threonine-protein kinase
MGSSGQSRAAPTTPKLPERYRARRHLASGGMASVWCAEDLVLGRAVAVKILAERFADDDIAVRRFKREARAAARVSTHAHVVTIYDVGDLEPDVRGGAGRAFIVMEYLAGGTVADAIRVGAVRRQEAVRWIREAASALDHAHVRGIVHRDIKPGNFLLNRSRVLHVADFGIARLVSEDTITTAGELFGTAAYLSPEQALGREATGASDRYALAVAAFELLAGERPFGAQQFAAQARQHVQDPPPPASHRDRTLPPPVDDVLIRGMAKQPEQRFGTAGEFVEALETALSGGIPAMSRSPTARTGVGARDGNGLRTRADATRPRRARVAPAPPTATWTPADSRQRVSVSRRRGGRALALIALLVAVVGVGALALAGLDGPDPPSRTSARTHKRKPATGAHPAAKPQAIARTPTATTASTPSTPTTATAPAAPPSAAQLQVTGHDEMLAGDYPVAIATLRKAVSAAAPGSLTYDYGLYDLGRSLLLSGDAAGAVTILEQRAKIPNQTPVVLETLNEALRADGQPTVPIPGQSSRPGEPAPADHAGRGAPSGGAGLTGKGHGHGGRTEHTSFVD